ncbi:hypothetical protein PMI01_03412 [Caulobacter sp. AP07]|nr:hypothetical protein PMI01_03412 [Caulobacter sp. AP07]
MKLSSGVLAAIVALGFATSVQGQAKTTYTYDAQGQVRSVATPAQTTTYAYDAAANRTSMTATNPPAGLMAGASAKMVSSDVAVARPAFVFPPPPADTPMPSMVAAPLPPPPISPLTGQPLPSASPSSSR